jgi:hypothetical protein
MGEKGNRGNREYRHCYLGASVLKEALLQVSVAQRQRGKMHVFSAKGRLVIVCDHME